AVVLTAVDKQLGERAIRKPANSADIAEFTDCELERLGELAIGKASARHRSLPEEAAAALCVGNIPKLRSWRSNASEPAFSVACGPRQRAMVAILLPQCR